MNKILISLACSFVCLTNQGFTAEQIKPITINLADIKGGNEWLKLNYQNCKNMKILNSIEPSQKAFPQNAVRSHNSRQKRGAKDKNK